MTNLKRLEDDRSKRLAEKGKTFLNNCDSLKKSCASNGKGVRSHDGVFLRPGAVSSSGHSPPLNARLSKRPSVDSGIGVEVSRQHVLRTGKYLKDFQKFSR